MEKRLPENSILHNYQKYFALIVIKIRGAGFLALLQVKRRRILHSGNYELPNNTITVFTYKLAKKVKNGNRRKILPARTIRFLTADFANRFIQGPNLPSGEILDDAVSRVLGIK